MATGSQQQQPLALLPQSKNSLHGDTSSCNGQRRSQHNNNASVAAAAHNKPG